MLDDAKISLGQAAEISGGYPFRSAVDALPQGDIGVIQMRNVAEGGVEWPSLAYVDLPSQRSAAMLVPGDVIFTTRGTRNFALALHDIPVPAVCSPHFFVLRARNPGELDPGFLAWQLNQRPAQEHFQREATGSHILNITRAAIEGLSIVVPPMRKQHQILAFDNAARAERAALAKLIEIRNQQIEGIAMRLHQSQKAQPNE